MSNEFQFLPILATVLVFAGASQAASLEWPSNLVALSSVKSSQLLPIASEDSVELSESSSGSVSSVVAQPEQPSEEDEDEEQQLSQSSSGSSDPIDARFLTSPPEGVRGWVKRLKLPPVQPSDWRTAADVSLDRVTYANQLRSAHGWTERRSRGGSAGLRPRVAGCSSVLVQLYREISV